MQLPKLLPTTVVGSFPCVKGTGLSALFDPYKKAVQFAVAEQIRAGVDIISDGQVRADMVQAFISKLPGISGNTVTSTVGISERPITVADTRYALTKTKYVKGILTGPCTLAYALKIETPAYRNRDELVLDLATALHSEAKFLAATGAYMIQVDEPILSTGVMDIETAKEALKIIFRDIETPSCIHTCGRLNTISSEWTRLPVDVIDFEYSVSPDNLSDISRHDLRNKKIGCGCVKSSEPEVESVAEIEKRIRSCVEVFGEENILIDPDCGLRMHTPEVAFAKLKNMCDAAKNVRDEL
ncbi:MAG: methionine synthase [Candidatus Methanocorpusculum faecipullorum]|nr:methionine synthase [Candidatus Methanocorpusculum faecipullorum]HJK57066.1 methionine synthase [Methanocorpusculum sp.]HJK61386.1 methionine synthase [Methanocorpusculum sp.]HJK64287.1 methionine synthase [Methanocorpusculum sp.]HJK67791.1 methionine synthase [Methanocorpusculum sp.]